MELNNNEQKLITFISTLHTIYDKALSTTNVGSIQQEFESKLKQMKNTILLKLMGFDDRYGNNSWEVDHCNGRAGQSVLGDRIRNAAQLALDSFLLDNNNGISILNILNENKDRLEQTITKEFNTQLQYKVKTYIEAEVNSLAKKKVEQLVAEAEANSLNVLDFMKTILEK